MPPARVCPTSASHRGGWRNEQRQDIHGEAIELPLGQGRHERPRPYSDELLDLPRARLPSSGGLDLQIDIAAIAFPSIFSAATEATEETEVAPRRFGRFGRFGRADRTEIFIVRRVGSASQPWGSGTVLAEGAASKCINRVAVWMHARALRLQRLRRRPKRRRRPNPTQPDLGGSQALPEAPKPLTVGPAQQPGMAIGPVWIEDRRSAIPAAAMLKREGKVRLVRVSEVEGQQ